VHPQAEYLCARKRLGIDARGAPVDVLENSQVRLTHADQVVTAIGGGADAHVSFRFG
jgi:hypothetical protein